MPVKKTEIALKTLSSGLFSLCSLAFRIGGAAFVLVGAYLIFATLSGQLKDATAGGVTAIHTMGRVFLLCGVVATASLVLITLEEIYWAVASGVVGLGLLFGIPTLVMSTYQGVPLSANGKLAAEAMVNWGTMTGKAIIFVVGLRLVYEIYRQLTEGSARRRVEEIEKPVQSGRRQGSTRAKPPSESVLAPCWKMQFCHETVREMCPAFTAKKTCWRYGRGCNCDPDLVESLIRNRASGPTRTAASREGAYIRAELEAETPRGPSEKTIPCARCPIYTEHQRRKFRVVNPLLIVITVALLSIFFVPLTHFYSVLAGIVAKAASGSLVSQGGNVAYWQKYLDTPALQACFVVIIGLFLLSWVLRAGEWLILEKKLV
ncbi:MAG TPA: hypothetical protein VGM19_10640 [Armatimonadota bacterium]|jgi:hypothetical protein